MAEKNIGFEEFLALVRQNQKYAQLNTTLVEQIAREELKNQKDWHSALKTTRTRLHQLTGAFLPPKINYAQLINNLGIISQNNSDELHAYSKQLMRLHASTNERLPFLERFFFTCLEPLGKVESILDLACGLNPLAIPWMPLKENYSYLACDVVDPMVSFLNSFFSQTNQTGTAFVCNLFQEIPKQQVEVAYLLKLLPILDQIDPSISTRLLDELNADHVLISYPSKSLGGRSKGMKQTYSQHLQRITEGRNFHIQEFTFPNEIAYLLSR
jgi:16S rRNA (guanine(1405)-N(7))-methyltransferase